VDGEDNDQRKDRIEDVLLLVMVMIMIMETEVHNRNNAADGVGMIE